MQEFIWKQFNFDHVNMLFVITGVFLTIFTSLASRYHIKQKQKWYYLLNLVYILSFSILIFTENWLIFLITWEMVTLTTTFMLLWSDRRIARQYFIIQFIGSSFLLYVILLAISQGYGEITAINETWLQNMFIFALGMKSAVFGLHFWLPPVHSLAPSPVSAILSGWVVKLGFITYLKLIPDGNALLIYLGFLMIFYGGIKALSAIDYKVLLAFSTISQLGYIALGIGSGTGNSYLGAVFHIIAHGLAKTTLFIGSTYWIKEYGSRSIYKFPSAFKRQKLNSYSTVAAFFSLIGLPLLAGYNSKYLIKYGFKVNPLLSLLFSLASVITILYAVRFLRWGIAGDINRSHKISKSKGCQANYVLNNTEKISIILPVLFLIGLGLFPTILLNYLNDNSYEFHLFTGFRDIILYFFLAIILLYKLNWLKIKEKEPPTLEGLFNRIYSIIYSFSAKAKEYDAAVFFEIFLYHRLFSLSRSLYRLVFSNFQIQLLWLPIFIIFLLLWKYIT